MGYYDLCNRNVGQVVRVREKCGRVHVGRITRVSRSHVFINPVSPSGPRGFGYGPYGYRPFGFGFGAGLAIGFGAIAALAVVGAFFW
ncbi:hypothetical protein Q73_08660 [Bacillus coahuilensis m2-6]|uniref:Uncharacterized protein n=1 Tax=Bacillus coahuilensis p1.1.43 TaxID=1150625 RepID=A0A147K822_9BACI|nr:hypothetical protein [Bacillus coahuilensis]KUP06292.1 hypothetical protein Q75_09135 [Bacillus coahuilensis p1.1.43]KUP07444.1 hypothetical protein Q73_08660 [Bacillus coahuilensis m2-6]